MSEFLAGLNCFITIMLFVTLIGVVGWMRGRLRQMQQQFDLLAQRTPSTNAAIQPTTAETTAKVPAMAQAPAEVVAPLPVQDLTPINVIRPENREALNPSSDFPQPLIKLPEKPHPLIAWFTKMNIMVQIGLIVLFFGVAFLVKYAADQGWLSIELRLTGATLLGVALAGVGWRVRHKARGYGLALIGGGIGIDYITTFAAYRLYELIPPSLTFAILVALGAIYTVMALLNNAQILAFLALVGGLLAPILASGEGGSHVMLFSYYFAINASILAIAWFKSWRLLNISSFGLTLLAAIGWGAAEYQSELFNSSEPFLILFFFFYLAISVLTIRRLGHDGKHDLVEIGDVLLLFANPLVTFALQYALVKDLGEATNFWMARTALGLATVYAALALGAARRWRNPAAVQQSALEAFLFLSTFFLAISIPLLYDARITAAIWAVMAVALHWLGNRRRMDWVHGWAVLVRLAATVAFALDIRNFLDDRLLLGLDLPLFTNHIYVGAVILSLSALLSAWLLWNQNRVGSHQTASNILLIWGLVWWFGSGMLEMVMHIANDDYILSSLIAFVALSSVAAEWIGWRLRWAALRVTLAVMLPMVLLLALLQFAVDEALWEGGNWYAWPLAIVAHFFALQRFESWQSIRLSWKGFYHATGVLLITFLCTRLLSYWLYESMTIDTWFMLPALLIPTLALAIVGIFTQRLPALLRTHANAYRIGAGLPLALYLVLDVLLISVNLSGESTPLPYLPVLNPLTLGLLALFVTLWFWLQQLGVGKEGSRGQLLWLAKLAVGTFAFVAFNAGLARDVHQLTGIDFRWDALFASEILQTTYAIVWSMIALVLMFWANRRGQWQSGWSAVWYFGAAVLALTVIKLFLVDLANTGAIARIVSFMGVGLLIIVIAYFAPLPPQRKELVSADAG